MATSAPGVTAPSFVNGVRESAQAAKAWLGRNIKWIGEKASNLVKAIVQLTKDLFGKIKQGGSEAFSTSAKFARENSRELKFAALGAIAMGIFIAVYHMCKKAPAPQEPPPIPVKVPKKKDS